MDWDRMCNPNADPDKVLLDLEACLVEYLGAIFLEVNNIKITECY